MNNFDFPSFLAGYKEFNSDTWSKLKPLYHQDALFIDPVHIIRGHRAIERYFSEMAQGLEHCQFKLGEPNSTDSAVTVTWQMTYAHSRLKNGELIIVDGITALTIANGLIVCHRDYYDLGQMVYEHVPVLGSLIGWLRKRLAGAHTRGAVNTPHGRYGGTQHDYAREK